MTSATDQSRWLMRQKTLAPGLPHASVVRQRLSRLYSKLLEEHEVLAVFAAAGSGKTVQAQLFADAEQWPVAWLTLDHGDHSPTRMLTYLAAALEPHVPGSRDVLEQAFRRTTMFEEQAVMLAEHIASRRLLIVIDQCENIADAERSCAVLEAFLDYVPGGVRAMLLSRAEMRFALSRQLLSGRVGRVVDQDLALTYDEAAELVVARGDSTEDLRSRWEAARGWVAAVAFGSSPSPERHKDRDLRGYLLHEVFDDLTEGQRQFLLDTSIADAVSRQVVVALCGAESLGTWHEVGLRHLPATTNIDQTVVYHPCLKNLLVDELESRDPARLRELQERYARLLLELGNYEDAVERLLALGLREPAADAATAAATGVLARGDWETLLRWTDAIGAEIVDRRPLLISARIKGLRGARRLGEARQLARDLEAAGRFQEVLDADPSVIAYAGWSMLWAPKEGLQFLEKYDRKRRAAGVRYMLEATSLEGEVLPPSGMPWTDTDRLISWALMVQGRLDDLMSMLPVDEWPPRTPYATPHALFALIWRGETSRARELYEQASSMPAFTMYSDLWHYLEAWLLLAEGRPEDAAAAAEQAVTISRLTEFGFDPVFQLVQSAALTSLGRTREAIALAEDALASCEEKGLLAYTEWAHTMRGYARLKDGDAEAARDDLRIAVQGMTRAGRRLMLPLAGVYLSEAERRLGHAEASALAASAALKAAEEMRASFMLSRTLEQFPEVLVQQQQGPHEAQWNDLDATDGSLVVVHGSRADAEVVHVEIQPFGNHPDIIVAGVSARVRRLKVVELACRVTSRLSGSDRNDLQAMLFPDSDRRKGSNHFRQVVHQLRKTTTLTLQRLPNSSVAWSPGFVVDATDLQFERLVAEARAHEGIDRLERLTGALALVTGPYLAASDLEWACERRYRLDVVQEEASLEIAKLALELGEHETARQAAERILTFNPYCDNAYRTLIEVELLVGTEAAAMAIYRRSVSALKELGLSPDERMGRLLRRAPA